MAGPFPYSNNIPQSTDQISQSQPLLLQNFQSIKLLIDQNHGDFSTALAGQHNYVQMPVQGAAPAVTAGEVGLYNLLNAGVNEMFVRKSDGTSVPMTKANLNITGYTYLPSGVILQWSSAAANTNPFGPINFPIAFPSQCFAVLLSMIVPTSADQNTFCSVIFPTVTTTGFSVNLFKRDSHGSVPSTNTGQFYYLAIGK